MCMCVGVGGRYPGQALGPRHTLGVWVGVEAQHFWAKPPIEAFTAVQGSGSWHLAMPLSGLGISLFTMPLMTFFKEGTRRELVRDGSVKGKTG